MRTLLALAVVASVLAPLRAGAADAPWLCRRATTVGTAPASAGRQVATSDRFAARAVTVASAAALCAPVHAADGEGRGRMVAYALRADATNASRGAGGRATVSTPLGRLPLRVRALEQLLVPSPVDATTARRTCWRVRGPRLTTAALRVTVRDAAGDERLIEVQRPERLCVADGAAPGDDALCFRARLARNVQPRPARFPRETATAPTALATETLRLGSRLELCVPATTVAPGPTIALTLDPTTADLEPGQRVAPRVLARFGDGRPDEDWSRRVGLRSSDESIAVGHASTAGAFVEGVGPGTATVTAIDRATGATSAPAGDAQVTVHWDLVRITLDPPMSLRALDGVESYTATGHFADGHTRNLTQRVLWSTSDPSVALAPNEPGRRSRVLARKPGVVGVTARDPISGLRTSGTGDDAVLRVLDEVRWITVDWEGGLSAARFPGESIRFTATGHMADGSTKNLTQRVVWNSGNLDVAVAPNDAGDASRVDVVGVGWSWIGCQDPKTGVTCYGTPLYGLGALQDVTLNVDPFPPMLPGSAKRLTAYGTYVGGGMRNLTQDVVWSSADPDVLATPNAPGDRSRVEARGGGLTTVVATDPATGIASAPQSMWVFGPLMRLELRSRWRGFTGLIGVGESPAIIVSGFYASPWSDVDWGIDLGRFFPEAYVLESSAPDVVAITPNGRGIVGVAAGTAEIRAHHLAADLRSPPLAVTVSGPLSSLRLQPTSAVRGIGEQEEFTAFGFFPPDIERQLTQALVYTSSDPTVVMIDDRPGRRSRIRTVGPGTATITATDPATGVSTHATGGDATITVLPGTLARIETTPPQRTLRDGDAFEFTATGHYPDGRTLNVTNQLTWYVRDEGVAAATNPQSHRSRIDALAPGTTLVGARHPSGLDTADTGDDARLDVVAVVELLLPQPDVRTTVHRQIRLPRVDARLGDGSVVRVRSGLWVEVDDWSIAWIWVDWLNDGQIWFMPDRPGTTGYTVHDVESGVTVRGTLTVTGEGSPAGAFVEAP